MLRGAVIVIQSELPRHLKEIGEDLADELSPRLAEAREDTRILDIFVARDDIDNSLSAEDRSFLRFVFASLRDKLPSGAGITLGKLRGMSPSWVLAATRLSGAEAAFLTRFIWNKDIDQLG